MRDTLESALVSVDVQRIVDILSLDSELKGKRLLLTGGTGFFGKWLLAMLACLNKRGAGIEVTVLSRAPARFLRMYPQYASVHWVRWIEHDVREPISVLVEGAFDMAIHAATDTLAGAHSDLLRLYDTILNGARNVLDLAVRTGTKRVLLTGSGAQYGVLEFGVPVSENSTGSCNALLASSAYAEAKRAQETLAAIYAARHGLEIVSTRCFAFSGPGIALDEHFAIGNFVRDALWRDELVLQSSGSAVRSYLHGSDLAGWLLALLVRGAPGNAYNVGSDQALTIAELARKVMTRIAPDKPLRILGQDLTAQARSYYVPSIQKARALGLDVWTTLEHSIDSMAQWAQAADRSAP
ncbi:NAD(P)-dependent oxidoreductase [Pseudomonas putida]|uniref:NAD-dependent epimerase/dehydratase family protein n=1 Tax=Pseudomonas putida TaxID=303 RepID=UPI00301D03C4